MWSYPASVRLTLRCGSEALALDQLTSPIDLHPDSPLLFSAKLNSSHAIMVGGLLSDSDSTSHSFPRSEYQSAMHWLIVLHQMHRDKRRSCGVGIACGFTRQRISVMSLGDFINEQQLVLIADRDDGVHIADVEVNPIIAVGSHRHP